jgi:hypothetical protein
LRRRGRTIDEQLLIYRNFCTKSSEATLMYCLQAISKYQSQSLSCLCLFHLFKGFHLLHSLLREGPLDHNCLPSLLRCPCFLRQCKRILVILELRITPRSLLYNLFPQCRLIRQICRRHRLLRHQQRCLRHAAMCLSSSRGYLYSGALS